ncbi:hypothetical protein BC833DRAFT_523616 [Globomyces pollinis-pini]|nr:hypothetical protein BC833DRAFT_523616 [Globomyces pollinis-pini]
MKSYNHTLFLYAKSLFDLKEFKRCTHTLRNQTDTKSIFLAFYASFLAIHSNTIIHDLSKKSNHSIGLYKELLDSLENYIHNNHPDSFILYLYGVVCKLVDRLDDAKQALIQSINKYPWNWSAWLELNSLIETMEMYNEIIVQLPASFVKQAFEIKTLNDLYQGLEAVEPIIEMQNTLAPNNRFCQIQRAILYHNIGDFEQSELLFDHINEIDPFLMESMDVYSNVLYVRKQLDKLCDLAHHISSWNPFRPESCVCIGNYYSSKDDHQKAIDSFSKAIKLDQSYSSAWILLGHEYIETHNPKAAIEVYRRATEINPKDYRAWFGLGQAYDILQLYNYSIYYYQKATAIRPNDARMWGALSSSYESTNNIHQAIKCLHRAINCDIILIIDYAKCAELYLNLKNTKFNITISKLYLKYINEHFQNLHLVTQ